MEELAEIYGGEVPEQEAVLHDEVRAFYHKRPNGPLDLQGSCLIAVLAEKLVPAPTKPARKTEKVSA